MNISQEKSLFSARSIKLLRNQCHIFVVVLCVLRIDRSRRVCDHNSLIHSSLPPWKSVRRWEVGVTSDYILMRYDCYFCHHFYSFFIGRFKHHENNMMTSKETSWPSSLKLVPRVGSSVNLRLQMEIDWRH